VAGRWRKLLWGIAFIAFLTGIGGALIRGFWGVSEDCHAWVNSHGLVGQVPRLRSPNTRR
jgi:hypothetical protein